MAILHFVEGFESKCRLITVWGCVTLSFFFFCLAMYSLEKWGAASGNVKKAFEVSVFELRPIQLSSFYLSYFL